MGRNLGIKPTRKIDRRRVRDSRAISLQSGGMTNDKPAIRVQWLIAMAIVGIALVALVWVLFGSSGVG